MNPDSAIPRVVSDVDLGGPAAARLVEVLKAITMILSLPRLAADRVDAVVVPTGQGEDWRLTHAIRSWQDNPAARFLLVANGNPTESTYVDLTVDYLRDLGLHRVEGVHIQAEPAPNTGLQATWIAGQVHRRAITSLALVVSAYHLPRVYLTVLKALDARGIRVPLIPMPVAVSPETPVPETGATAYDLLPGEVERILSYMDRGWVATPEELRHYLRWLWAELT